MLQRWYCIKNALLCFRVTIGFEDVRFNDLNRSYVHDLLRVGDEEYKRICIHKHEGFEDIGKNLLPLPLFDSTFTAAPIFITQWIKRSI